TPQAMADGTIEEIDGRYVLRFERRFKHPVERVWGALTQPDQIPKWWGEGEVELDLVEGGKYHVRTTGPPELVEAIIAEAGGGGAASLRSSSSTPSARIPDRSRAGSCNRTATAPA